MAPRVAVPADGPDRAPPWDALSGDDPPPGPGLAQLLGAAVGALGELNERQVLGAGAAARRQRAHDDYIEVMAVAELGRLRAGQLEAPKARGDRARSRGAEHPAEECPLCQRHHHAKHAPGWKLQQTQPGVMRWTTPSGRTYTTHPTQYDE